MTSIKKLKQDTIAAIATPSGQGAIGVLRISGPKAKTVLDSMWLSMGGQAIKPRELTLGWLSDGKSKLDQTLAVFMPDPNSYTGEDVVEIHTHGSSAITQVALKLAWRHGARTAEPGEFTKRAYLNGKMDLVQAEAVADLIAAENETMVRLATDQLAGSLSREIKSIRDEVIKLAAHEAANLDFSEEDIDPADIKNTIASLEQVKLKIDQLLRNSDQVAVLRNGYKVALIGLPNAGKSTLLNNMLGYERSIVADIAGTTRDTIEEAINMSGINVRLVDTAGLNIKPGEIERLGIERTKIEISNSDLVLLLVEPGQEEATRSYVEEWHLFDDLYSSGGHIIVVWTKSDLAIKPNKNKLGINAKEYIAISAINDLGLKRLHQIIASSASHNGVIETASATTERQLEILSHAQTLVANTQKALGDGLGSDALVVDLEEISQILGGLTGDTTNQEMIDSIFANFCVGK